MNTDSKLKRFIVLLDKAPFVLFLKRETYPSVIGNLGAVLILKETTLTKVFSTITTLPDPLAFNIIEALADALPNKSMYFPVHFFTKSDWQNYIEWQSVEAKPEPITHEYTITVDRITHELNTIYSENLESSTKAYDGVINLSSVDINVPFPKALLKECTMEIYNIIVQKSVGRITADKVKSKYLSVMQSGHDTFNYISLRQIEKDLIAVLTTANVTIEE